MSDTLKASELGPQHPRDTRFTARMRRHQSWWRATQLKVHWGTGPTAGSQTESGSMLRRVDGEAMLNFLTPEIRAAVKKRLAEGVGVIERFRLLNNLLSSQPMCFNLFGALDENRELATRLLDTILPGEVAEVLKVKVEYAPEPASEYLADSTDGEVNALKTCSFIIDIDNAK